MRDRTSFHFAHLCEVPAPLPDVHSTLVDLEHYPDWWPQVRAVAKLDDDHALVVCRSALPYDLELELTALDRSTRRLEVGISGPIEGSAVWHLTPVTGGTRLSFDQHVTARAPLFVLGSWLARPVLEWNHRQMMSGAARGLAHITERSLRDR